MDQDFSDSVIDISHYQTVSSFHDVKAGGILAVIHKCSEGPHSVDHAYKSNHERATAAGLLWGSYHFLRPGNPELQAEHFLRNVVHPSTLMLDCEVGGCTQQEAETFVNFVREQTNLFPIFYTYEAFLPHLLQSTSDVLSQCPLAIAKYSSKAPHVPDTWSTWSLWQNSDGTSGFAHSVPGIGKCDRDRFHRPASELEAWWREHSLA